MQFHQPITSWQPTAQPALRCQPFSYLPMGGFPELFARPQDQPITIPHVAPKVADARKCAPPKQPPKQSKRRCSLADLPGAKRSKPAYDRLDTSLSAGFDKHLLEHKGVLENLVALKTAIAMDIKELSNASNEDKLREESDTWRHRAHFYQAQLEHTQVQMAAFVQQVALAATPTPPPYKPEPLPPLPVEPELPPLPPEPIPEPLPLPAEGDIEAPEPFNPDMFITMNELEELLNTDPTPDAENTLCSTTNV